jgi:hypothetical protein
MDPLAAGQQPGIGIARVHEVLGGEQAFGCKPCHLRGRLDMTPMVGRESGKARRPTDHLSVGNLIASDPILDQIRKGQRQPGSVI